MSGLGSKTDVSQHALAAGTNRVGPNSTQIISYYRLQQGQSSDRRLEVSQSFRRIRVKQTLQQSSYAAIPDLSEIDAKAWPAQSRYHLTRHAVHPSNSVEGREQALRGHLLHVQLRRVDPSTLLLSYCVYVRRLTEMQALGVVISRPCVVCAKRENIARRGEKAHKHHNTSHFLASRTHSTISCHNRSERCRIPPQRVGVICMLTQVHHTVSDGVRRPRVPACITFEATGRSSVHLWIAHALEVSPAEIQVQDSHAQTPDVKAAIDRHSGKLEG